MKQDDLSAALAGLARILLPLSREDRASVLFLSRWLEGAPLNVADPILRALASTHPTIGTAIDLHRSRIGELVGIAAARGSSRPFYAAALVVRDGLVVKSRGSAFACGASVEGPICGLGSSDPIIGLQRCVFPAGHVGGHAPALILPPGDPSLIGEAPTGCGYLLRDASAKTPAVRCGRDIDHAGIHAEDEDSVTKCEGCSAETDHHTPALLGWRFGAEDCIWLCPDCAAAPIGADAAAAKTAEKARDDLQCCCMVPCGSQSYRCDLPLGHAGDHHTDIPF